MFGFILELFIMSYPCYSFRMTDYSSYFGETFPKVTAIIFMECFICQPKTYEIQV